jgi:CRP/FNR family transcriptional regulator
MTSKAEFLKTVEYFSPMSPAELEQIGSLFFEKSCLRDEIILLEGEQAEALYLVVSGVVKIFKTSADGKEQILNIIRPGESFNEVPMLDSGLNPASAQAMGRVLLYGLGKDELDYVLRNYPQLASSVIKVMAGRMRHLVSLVEDLSFRQVIGRVARILLENAGEGVGPSPQLTQRDMAAMAGTVREVVSRSLKTLEEEGAIKMDRHRIIISNKNFLQKMVEPYFETKVTDRG